MVGYEDGTIRVWDLKQGNSIHVLKGIWGGESVNLGLCGAGAETWDRMKSDLFLCFILGTEGHQGPLTCVATNQDGSLILTGSVDCQAKLVSATTGKVSGTWSLALGPPLSASPPLCLLFFTQPPCPTAFLLLIEDHVSRLFSDPLPWLIGGGRFQTRDRGLPAQSGRRGGERVQLRGVLGLLQCVSVSGASA